MAKCSICHSRKGKRLCMVFDGFACSLCCGQTRKKSSCKECTYYKPPEESRLSGQDILLRKVKESDEYGNSSDKVFFEPKGLQKMSEIILEFAEPLLEEAPHYEARKKVIYFAIMVWNMSFFSKEEQKKQTQDLMNIICKAEEKLVIKTIKHSIDQLLKRKKRYFAKENRKIANWHIKKGGRYDLHLDVVSIIPEKSITKEMKSELRQNIR